MLPQQVLLAPVLRSTTTASGCTSKYSHFDLSVEGGQMYSFNLKIATVPLTVSSRETLVIEKCSSAITKANSEMDFLFSREKSVDSTQ